MKKCPFCAEDIQDAAIVCKHCRRELTAARLHEQRTPAQSGGPALAVGEPTSCAQCGRTIKVGDETCRHCGEAISWAEGSTGGFRQQASTSVNKPTVPAASPNVSVGAVLSLLVLIGVVWFYFGGGLERQASRNLQDLQSRVAADFEQQYHIAKRNGTPIDVCVQAGLVAAGYLQAKNETAYQRWKQIEKSGCEKAGIPK